MKFVITGSFLDQNITDINLLRKKWMLKVRSGYGRNLDMKSVKYLADILFDKTDGLKKAKHVEMDFSELELPEQEMSIIEEISNVLIKREFSDSNPDNPPFLLDMSNKYGFDTTMESPFEEAQKKEDELKAQILLAIPDNDKERVTKLLKELVLHVSSHSGAFA